MEEERPPEEPATLFEWLWRLRRYESGIFVRAKMDGKFESVALSTLPPKEWAERVAGWLEKGALPVRVREDEEIEAVEPEG